MRVTLLQTSPAWRDVARSIEEAERLLEEAGPADLYVLPEMWATGFDAELAEVWVEQMQFVEEAECTVMHLFARAPWASDKAFEWIASPSWMHELCGYLLLARLFMQGLVPGVRDLDEFLDQAATAPQRQCAGGARGLQSPTETFRLGTRAGGSGR